MRADELAGDLIGRTLEEAGVLAAAVGLRLTIVSGSIADAMIDPGRIEVRVRDGVIQEAWADAHPSGRAPESEPPELNDEP